MSKKQFVFALLWAAMLASAQSPSGDVTSPGETQATGAVVPLRSVSWRPSKDFDAAVHHPETLEVLGVEPETVHRSHLQAALSAAGMTPIGSRTIVTCDASGKSCFSFAAAVDSANTRSTVVTSTIKVNGQVLTAQRMVPLTEHRDYPGVWLGEVAAENAGKKDLFSQLGKAILDLAKSILGDLCRGLSGWVDDLNSELNMSGTNGALPVTQAFIAELVTAFGSDTVNRDVALNAVYCTWQVTGGIASDSPAVPLAPEAKIALDLTAMKTTRETIWASALAAAINDTYR